MKSNPLKGNAYGSLELGIEAYLSRDISDRLGAAIGHFTTTIESSVKKHT